MGQSTWTNCLRGDSVKTMRRAVLVGLVFLLVGVSGLLGSMRGGLRGEQDIDTISSNNFYASDFVTSGLSRPVSEVVVVGDVMLGRSVNYKAWQKSDWKWVFADTDDLLREADVAVANLESPLVASCPLTNEGMVFCGDLRWAKGLSSVGIDVVSVANNHATNYGADGLKESVKSLRDAGIGIMGYGEGYYKEVGGVIFGFVGFNDVGTYPDVDNANYELIKTRISEANGTADVVIVYYHWGSEYTAKPARRQVEFAHASVDYGADVVVGTHPHWTQTVEKYRDKLIVYSLGNFVFDQMWSEETRKGKVLSMQFNDDRLVSYQLIPVWIEDYGRPILR